MLTLVVGGGCEEWQFGHVLPCLKDVLYGINGTYNILAGTDTETVKTFCSDGSTNRTVSCLENLYQECGQHNGLLNIAQPQTWRNTFTGLCSNLSSHAIYSDCIVQQRDTVRHCLHNNDELLQRLLKKHTDTTQTFVMKICSYFKGIHICTVNPVRDVDTTPSDTANPPRPWLGLPYWPATFNPFQYLGIRVRAVGRKPIRPYYTRINSTKTRNEIDAVYCHLIDEQSRDSGPIVILDV
ncbi:uncharacterized protein LOC128215896 [Mya arenaria]|uniref:uncharacterized protein LOC128215896 n=1 Tax=Mya arenaria TaxID=6604 RepID=UPI0022E0A1D2|nr:uncharacterized protein LOC128215896 [Mya arenaria]